MAQISKEYAEALFALALEGEQVAEYEKKLSLIDSVMEENPEYIELVDSPAVLLSERLGVLDESFGDMPEYILSFLKLLCENRHFGEIRRIISDFSELVRLSENRAEATVYYASPLDDAQKAALIERLEKKSGKKVEAVYVYDESLIGGIKVKLDDIMLDGSISGRLNKIKGVIGK